MPLPALRVSPDRRAFVTADGAPFFYLADTAWELFHRLDREAAAHYLERRAAQGFNVVQAVALAELDGLRTPNPYGATPLHDLDPTRPNEAYFAHVDWVVARANALGLYVALLPTWGDKWNRRWGDGPEVFTPANAAVFGEWLGRRYRDAAVLWMIGGDRAPENPDHHAILRAMAGGLRRGDGGVHLLTAHVWGNSGSADWFPRDGLLDFDTRQNGHAHVHAPYARTRAEHDREPPIPVIDAEPLYEDHPLAFDAWQHGYSLAADVRRAFYWDVFGGACGHAYGHHSVWQFYEPGRDSRNAPTFTWREALDRPGVAQMALGRRLLESRPLLGRVPDDDLFFTDRTPPLVPGAGTRRFAATRAGDGSHAMLYVPVGQPFTVRLEKLAGPTLRAWWFDPRTGRAEPAGEFSAEGVREFVPPMVGELLDWVLVLDQASRAYAAPGTRV